MLLEITMSINRTARDQEITSIDSKRMGDQQPLMIRSYSSSVGGRKDVLFPPYPLRHPPRHPIVRNKTLPKETCNKTCCWDNRDWKSGLEDLQSWHMTGKRLTDLITFV